MNQKKCKKLRRIARMECDPKKTVNDYSGSIWDKWSDTRGKFIRYTHADGSYKQVYKLLKKSYKKGELHNV
jgi:hypothetical protein